MQDTVSSTSTDIFEAASGGPGRHTFIFSVRRRDGAPAAGEDLRITLQGDGGLSPGSNSADIRRELDASGTTRVTWYRRSIYGRDVKARLTVSLAKPGFDISIEETSPETSTTSYDFGGRNKTHL